MNPNKKEVVAAPGRYPSSQDLLLSPGPPLPWGARAFLHSWLLHLGRENLEKVSLQCCLAMLVLLITRNRQEFIILL